MLYSLKTVIVCSFASTLAIRRFLFSPSHQFYSGFCYFFPTFPSHNLCHIFGSGFSKPPTFRSEQHFFPHFVIVCVVCCAHFTLNNGSFLTQKQGKKLTSDLILVNGNKRYEMWSKCFCFPYYASNFNRVKSLQCFHGLYFELSIRGQSVHISIRTEKYIGFSFVLFLLALLFQICSFSLVLKMRFDKKSNHDCSPNGRRF